MKVRKYLAPNSREALAQARAELGAEAVVLSSRQTSHGFELLALAKDDIATLVQAGREEPGRELPRELERSPAARRAAAQAAPARSVPQPKAFVAAPPSVPPAARAAPKPQTAQPWTVPQAAAPAPVAPARSPAPAAEPRLLEEIRALRGMVEEQGAHFAWMQNVHARPLRATLLREMILAGLSPALARKIAEALPDDFSADEARHWLAQALARNLRCAGAGSDPFERGGIFALVGPTGVGKTTTAAKLAACCVVRHGAGSLGLISSDHYRIGAQDQLRIYGRILGVAVHAVHDAESLGSALDALAGKRLVIIDSIGVGQRDTRVAEQTVLFDRMKISRVLLFSAASQAETLEEVVLAYGADPLAGAILTKTDEAVSLGGALDCAIRHRLQLSHVTNGQRVPEDIHVAQAAYLVHRALSANRASAFRLDAKELDLLSFSAGSAGEGADARR
ncbi:MAG: flagellar biosynthesis protein FlhF [Betaproteobacteria bacterium]|nr:flagellar biosynthesis protein FlhF [Betaproteobacteria bacterium]